VRYLQRSEYSTALHYLEYSGHSSGARCLPHFARVQRAMPLCKPIPKIPWSTVEYRLRTGSGSMSLVWPWRPDQRQPAAFVWQCNMRRGNATRRMNTWHVAGAAASRSVGFIRAVHRGAAPHRQCG
jgi:hypothetical protein